MYCWGNNQFGKLGDGNAGTSSATPVMVAGGLTFTTVTAGIDQSCAVTTGGAAYCWGWNSNGQLGTGNTGGESDTPVAVVGGLTFETVTAGVDHSCGVGLNGDAYCWGSNFQGQLGDGTTISRSTPVAVSGGHTWADVQAGLHTCGITVDGLAYCWGRNFFGQLGNGEGGKTGPTETPVRVLGPR